MKPATLIPFDFRFRRLAGGRVLLTNDLGEGVTLKTAEFNKFIAGRPGPGAAAGLALKGFVRNRMDMEGVAAGLGERFFTGWKGQHVHIISLNDRCNLNCVYCGAGASAVGRG